LTFGAWKQWKGQANDDASDFSNRGRRTLVVAAVALYTRIAQVQGARQETPPLGVQEQKEETVSRFVRFLSDFGAMRVPSDSYFVMADRRRSSNDSRVFGAVARRLIHGRAVFAYWPMNHFGSLPATASTEAKTK
jgi:hypothetical protein